MGLEDRQVPAIADIKAVATPNLLTPPNNKFVQVTVSGSVTDSGSELPLVHYQTVDEYRLNEPGAALALTPTADPKTFDFRFTVVLQARRANIDPSGRLYVITVGAQDTDGSRGVVLPVLVPHGLTAPPKPVHKLPPLKPTPANPTSGTNKIPIFSGSFFKNLFGQASNLLNGGTVGKK